MSTVVANNTASRELKIDITSDSICPFCYIGKRKLDKAIEIAEQKGLNLKIQREYHPFMLDSALRDNSARDKRAHYENKFGKERFEMFQPSMKARGKEVGIDFSFGGKISQTTDSHRLIALAYEKGGEQLQSALIDRLFKGYFECEEDIGCRDFLSSQAVESGLFRSVDEAKAWLSTDEKKMDVAKGIFKAQSMGITGVPFFVLNDKYAISGAEDPEVFLQVFEKLAASKEL